MTYNVMIARSTTQGARSNVDRSMPVTDLTDDKKAQLVPGAILSIAQA